MYIGGQKEVCGFELAENETVSSLITRLSKKRAYLGEIKRARNGLHLRRGFR